jgi:nicotinate-nucleotide pyrophosphorylase (carboxylating)
VSTVDSPLPILYEDTLRAALTEDLGRAGDLTTDAIVPCDQQARARIVAREEGRVAGSTVAGRVFTLLDSALTVAATIGDGSDVEAGGTILELEGSARAILTGERTALNLLGRLCGIATATRNMVAAARDTGADIVCTRKTTPGLRLLEKHAVRCGGGANHRFGLDDAVLIKDNHVALAGGVARAIEAARRRVGHTVTIEAEVDTLEQLNEALATGVDIVLLDNMTPDQLREAVRRCHGRTVTEASGGITAETVHDVAATGVDLISVGALTHSVRALDISLEVSPRKKA